MTIQETKTALNAIGAKIEDILKKTGFETLDGYYPDEFETKTKDKDGYVVADLTADEWLIMNEYDRLLRQLDEVAHKLRYLNRPIRHEGKLYKNEDGRFEVDGYDLHCGYGIEYQVYDDEHDCYKWVAGTVEASSELGGYFYAHTRRLLKVGDVVRVR